MEGALSSVKYIIFFIVLCVGVPAGFSFAKTHPKFEKIIFFLMVFFTVKMEDINFVSRETFRLTSKGFEIGLVDIATFIILLLVLHRKHQYKLELPPGSYFFFAYFFFSILSIMNSAVVLFSMFEVWKMLRMYLYFWVIYNYINSFDQYDDFLKGVAACTLFVFEEVMKQKYVFHVFQTAGPFPHQNSLVMYMIIFSSLMFAYLLNRKNVPAYKFSMWLILFGMAAVCIVSTLSRAGIVLFSFSCAIILGVSLLSGVNSKKIVVTLLLLVMGIAIFVRAWDSISERFRTAPEESATTRVDLAKAAVKMANDKLFGIGLNNFGHKINPPYPYSSHIEMHNEDDEDEKNGLVETVYLMIAAETGWHNLAVFFLMLFYFYFMNVRNFIRLKNSNYQFIAIGLIGGLLAIYLESTLEWVLKQTNNFYQLMLIFALIASMDKLYRRKKLLEKKRSTVRRIHVAEKQA